MPAVEAEALLGLVKAVGADRLDQAGVGRGELFVLLFFLVLEVVGAAEVVFRAGAGDGRKLLVAVEIEGLSDFPLKVAALA